MQSNKDQENLLKTALSWQEKTPPAAVKLGGIARGYLDEKSPGLRKNAKIVDIWKEALPPGIAEHCSITKIEKGVIYVEADSSIYMHELQVMSVELLEYINSSSSNIRIKKIITRPARANIQDE